VSNLDTHSVWVDRGAHAVEFSKTAAPLARGYPSGWHVDPVRPGSGRTEEYSRCGSLGTKPRRPDFAANFAAIRTIANTPTERVATRKRACKKPLQQANTGKPALAELHDLAVDLGTRQIERIGGNGRALDLHAALPDQPAGFGA